MEPDRTRHDRAPTTRLRAVGDGTHPADVAAHRERLILIAEAEADRIIGAARIEAADLKAEARRILLDARGAATRLVALAEEQASWRARLDRIGFDPDVTVDLRAAPTPGPTGGGDPGRLGAMTAVPDGGVTAGSTVYQRRGGGLRERIERSQGREATDGTG